MQNLVYHVSQFSGMADCEDRASSVEGLMKKNDLVIIKVFSNNHSEHELARKYRDAFWKILKKKNGHRKFSRDWSMRCSRLGWKCYVLRIDNDVSIQHAKYMQLRDFLWSICSKLHDKKPSVEEMLSKNDLENYWAAILKIDKLQLKLDEIVRVD